MLRHLCLRNMEAQRSLLDTFCLAECLDLVTGASHPIPTAAGEFEKHVACWMGWPDSEDTRYLWREGGGPAQEQYADIATAISQFEPLIMLANPGQVRSGCASPAANARKAFEKRGATNTEVWEVPGGINDGWLRDWGPTCIRRKNPETGKSEVAGVHWNYDCYGEQAGQWTSKLRLHACLACAPEKKKLGLPTMMPNWDKDIEAGRFCLTKAGLEIFEAPLACEGGSIHSDGEGTLVVTEETILHPSRNPHLSKDEKEHILKEYLGLEKIIWLWRGMAGDDIVVNGHVDNMASFVRPGVIALSWSDDVNDPQHEISARNLEILENTIDAQGRKLEVIKVHCPPPMFRTFKEAAGFPSGHVDKGYSPCLAQERLSGSYINHYIANGGAVIPQFGGTATDTDRLAIETLQKAYGPERKVVGVKSREVLLNAGNVHCITQQWPAA
eukprot:jgi/Astpho2/9156/Aster-07801